MAEIAVIFVVIPKPDENHCYSCHSKLSARQTKLFYCNVRYRDHSFWLTTAPVYPFAAARTRPFKAHARGKRINIQAQAVKKTNLCGNG